jgi:hypothetical protein
VNCCYVETSLPFPLLWVPGLLELQQLELAHNHLSVFGVQVHNAWKFTSILYGV